MAITYAYPNAYGNCKIVRASTGGTVYSADVAAAAFDYFTDTAVVNDALYFSSTSINQASLANIKVNVGTAIAGTGITGVWEYWCSPRGAWDACHDMTDPTMGFTVTGANTITVPIQAGMGAFNTATIGGYLYYCWIRYRITAITTITEGGANQTTRPTVGDGILAITGGTLAVPATFAALYTWILANAPEIGATKIGTSGYKFDNIHIAIWSYLVSTNQQIFLGNGAMAFQDISYLQAGTLVGTDGWKDDTYIFLCTTGSSNYLTTSANTAFYGGGIISFSNFINGYNRNHGSYIGLTYGTYVGTTIASQYSGSGYFSSLTANKITIPGNIITSNFPVAYPTNVRISDAKTSVWRVYTGGGTISGVSYPLPTTSVFWWNQYGGESPTINLINPSPTLPAQTDAVKVMGRTATAPTTALTKVFFNDVSAGTFTDYTTAAGNATADDVPLDGDVGDCYYFYLSTIVGSYYQLPLAFTITDQANDYVYVWEYYRNSAWNTVEKTFDTTNNLTTSGRVYNATRGAWTAVAINGTTGLWLRLRITTKGTGTPKCTQIKGGVQTGVGDWRIYEKMSFVAKVVDKDGTAIEGASVAVLDNLGNTTTVTTAASGLTPSTDIVVSTTQFDPTESDANYNVKKNANNPFTITVSKAGYENYILKQSITGSTLVNIALKKSPSILVDDGTIIRNISGNKYQKVG